MASEGLRALEAVGECGSFLQAAERLGKGHPSVLYAVQRLELTTGLTLVNRTGYRAQLTAAGEQALIQIRRRRSIKETR